ncbi:MAG TPA: multicopper oxidase domain-containing protein [Micromonosporaceae bacterium]
MRPAKALDLSITRRTFLAGSVASGALLAVGAGSPSVSAAVTTTRYPLYVPPTVGLASAYTLNARPGRIDLGGGNLANAWLYNGSMPGPSFRGRTGDTAQITVVNGLSQETITHWHGMIIDHANDGQPVYAIPPGGTYAYSFPIRQRAAMNWYHPHPHLLTGQQVALGLAGAFIINDAEEDALGLPSGAYEVPLVIRDASLDATGNLQYKPRSGGFVGDTVVVNGTRDPYLNVDTALYRFRVLGGSNARIFGLTLSNGVPFTLIGNDGGLLTSAVQLSRVDVSPGERYDLLVDFRNLPVGTTMILRDARSGWDLLEFRVTRSVTVPGTIPTSLSTITSLSSPVRTRTFSFDGMGRINGQEYDMHRVDFQVPFGDVERWRFTTNGNAPHPVHIHGASFQVMSRSGGRNRLFPWESGWKDTVLLEDRETVEILIRFDAYRGMYLMHCHKLEHEDLGMMSNFMVV